MLSGQMNPGRSRINPGWILHPVYHPYFCSYPSLSFQIERINLSFFHGKWEKAPRQTQWLCALFWPLNFIWASIEYKQVEENLSESQHQCLNHHSGEKRQRKPDTKWHSFLWLRERKRETESGRGRGRERERWRSDTVCGWNADMRRSLLISSLKVVKSEFLWSSEVSSHSADISTLCRRRGDIRWSDFSGSPFSSASDSANIKQPSDSME